MPMLAEVGDVIPDFGQASCQLAMGTDRDSPPINRCVRVRESVGSEAFQHPNAVTHEAQIARGGDLRILLTQRSSCRIPGIGEGRLSGQDERFIESGEVSDCEVHLSTYLERLRN